MENSTGSEEDSEILKNQKKQSNTTSDGTSAVVVPRLKKMNNDHQDKRMYKIVLTGGILNFLTNFILVDIMLLVLHLRD